MLFPANAGNRRNKPRTLLKIVLNTLNTATTRWQDKIRFFSAALANQPMQKEQIKVMDNFHAHVLSSLDSIALMQITYYMKTESD